MGGSWGDGRPVRSLFKSGASGPVSRTGVGGQPQRGVEAHLSWGVPPHRVGLKAYLTRVD